MFITIQLEVNDHTNDGRSERKRKKRSMVIGSYHTNIRYDSLDMR